MSSRAAQTSEESLLLFDGSISRPTVSSTQVTQMRAVQLRGDFFLRLTTLDK